MTSAERGATVWIVSTRGMEALGWAVETSNKTKLRPNEALVVRAEDHAALQSALQSAVQALQSQNEALREALEQARQDRNQAQVAEERYRTANEQLVAALEYIHDLGRDGASQKYARAQAKAERALDADVRLAKEMRRTLSSAGKDAKDLKDGGT